MGTDDYNSFGTNRVAYSFTGCGFSSGGGTDPWYTFVANDSDFNAVGLGGKAASNIAPAQLNIMHEHNNIKGFDVNGATGGHLYIDVPLNGFSMVGNVLECKQVLASGPMIWIGGDDASDVPIQNVILARNTTVGERCNLFYNDKGSVALLRTQIFMYGNAFRSMNVKGDNFAPVDANRIGNRAQMLAVNFHDNVFDGSADGSFRGDYFGVRSSYELAGDFVTFGELGYVDERSSDTNGLGNGDYEPAPGSVLLGLDVEPDFMFFDQKGNPRDSTTVGAIFFVQSAPIISAATPNNAEELTSITVNTYDTVSDVSYNSVSLADVVESTVDTITATMVKGGQAFGSSNDFTVTDANGTSAPFAATFNTRSDSSFVVSTVDFASLPIDSIGLGVTELSGMQAGDQISYTNDSLGETIVLDGQLRVISAMAPGSYTSDMYFLDANVGYAASATGTAMFDIVTEDIAGDDINVATTISGGQFGGELVGDDVSVSVTISNGVIVGAIFKTSRLTLF
jgi:hypothetical protein